MIQFFVMVLIGRFLQTGKVGSGNTPPLAKLIWVKNLRAIVVCWFLMKWVKIYPENLKKIMGAVWELPAK